MKSPNDLPSIRLRVGAVSVKLASNVRRLRREYRSLYEPFVRPGADVENPDPQSPQCERESMSLSVMARRTRCGLARHFEIRVDDSIRFTPSSYPEVLPYLEWALNWELPRRRPECLWLHAAAMERNGVGVIFPADSGSGKSTLALALIARGWRYLCDEFAILRADNLQLEPFPRAICVKASANHLLPELGFEAPGKGVYIKGVKGRVSFLNPLLRNPAALGRTCPVGHVIFPAYRPGAVPTLTPVPRAQAVLDLHRVAFNLFGCHRPALGMLVNVARNATCHRLVTGELTRTCDILDNVMENRGELARSA